MVFERYDSLTGFWVTRVPLSVGMCHAGLQVGYHPVSTNPLLKVMELCGAAARFK